MPTNPPSPLVPGAPAVVDSRRSPDRRRSCRAAGVLLAVVCSTAAADEPEVRWTLAEVRRGAAAARAQIQSVYYEATSQGRVALTPAGVLRPQRHVVAIKGYRRFVETIHLWPGSTWEEDADWTRNYMREGTMEVLWVLRRHAEVSREFSDVSNNPKLEPVFEEFLLECSGWWPEDSSADASQQALVPEAALHKVLAHPDAVLKETLDVVRERPCVVVSVHEGHTQLWLDTERGGALVRRHVTLDNGLYAVYENSDFHEVAPGSWLPWRMERTLHRGDRPGDLSGGEPTILSQSIREVTKMEVNNVADHLFKMQPPPGTIVVDKDHDTVEFIPGGLELLDEFAAISQKMVWPEKRSSEKLRSVWLYASAAWALISASCLAVAIGWKFATK